MSRLNLFYHHVRTNPENIAIEIDDQKISYYELSIIVEKISYELNPKEEFIGVLGHKVINTYASILSIHSVGSGYVPLNPNFPIKRTVQMVRISGIKTIIIPNEVNENTIELEKALPEINFLNLNKVMYKKDNKNINPKIKNHINAYILFTSGSTGVPKGVTISNQNLNSYINFLIKAYPLLTTDRCSQVFDLTFDLSIHDVFVTLSQGACLVPLSNSDIYFPANFIKKKKITVWFSVPSLVNIIDKMNQLSSDYLASLRLTFFCGEALEYRIANKWIESAHNSKVINLYGPTEATIAITHFEISEKGNENEIVPIGRIFDGNHFDIIPSNNELVLSGSQLTNSYLNNPEKTKESFVNINGKEFYKTGDKVKILDNQLHYISRIDSQVKINGNRVELSEVEKTYRGIIKNHQLVVLKYTDPSYNDCLVLFINTNKKDEIDFIRLNDDAKSILPQYMIPSKICFKDVFPTNSNGKIDRKKLLQSYEEELQINS